MRLWMGTQWNEYCFSSHFSFANPFYRHYWHYLRLFRCIWNNFCDSFAFFLDHRRSFFFSFQNQHSIDPLNFLCHMYWRYFSCAKPDLIIYRYFSFMCIFVDEKNTSYTSFRIEIKRKRKKTFIHTFKLKGWIETTRFIFFR